MRAVIFDVDGLMVDSEPLSRQAWDEVLRDYDCSMDDLVYHRIVGQRTRDSARIVRDAYSLPLTADDLAAAKTARWEMIWRRGLPPMPGLMALHEELAARGVPWAVATSSPHLYAEAVLQQLGLAPTRGAVAAGDEVPHGKPAPDIYLLAAERLGIAPEQCLALEDSVPGARAAQAAGMCVVVVPNGVPPERLEFADYVFRSLSDVAEQLDTLLGAAAP
ncbi:MAG: HAD family phosphatase [Chloroflexi bacterium]|nr:HAD family phosphatase [Chloroflexota bacterium]